MEDIAVSQMYLRWGPLIFRHCRRIVGAGPAEDLTQEVFVRLWRRRAVVREAEDGGWPVAWVYRVATNVCLTWLRDNRHRRTEPLPEQIQGGGPDTAGQAVARVTLEKLLGACDERTRAIVLLVHGSGFTQEETAETLSVSRRTVGKRLRAFQVSVRARMEKDDGVERDSAELARLLA